MTGPVEDGWQDFSSKVVENLDELDPETVACLRATWFAACKWMFDRLTGGEEEELRLDDFGDIFDELVTFADEVIVQNTLLPKVP